jgi:NAD(P)-dependent dehydrogenase (short-subunit alcohol dehydrogenase family)
MDFSDQTVIVTGASGNLGRAVFRAFAERDANVVLVDRRTERLVEHYGPETKRTLYVAADLTRRSDTDGVARQTSTRFGRVDVLCNIAGGFTMGDAVHVTSDDTWDSMFDANVRSVRNMVAAVVPLMLDAGGGRIVNVGALSAHRGVANMGAYTAAKSVVLRLTEAMAAELGERNINVNCVLPSTLDTPQNRAAMPKTDPARFVAPADVANVIVFLASAAARAIHGAAVPVTASG